MESYSKEKKKEKPEHSFELNPDIGVTKLLGLDSLNKAAK